MKKHRLIIMALSMIVLALQVNGQNKPMPKKQAAPAPKAKTAAPAASTDPIEIRFKEINDAVKLTKDQIPGIRQTIKMHMDRREMMKKQNNPRMIQDDKSMERQELMSTLTPVQKEKWKIHLEELFMKNLDKRVDAKLAAWKPLLGLDDKQTKELRSSINQMYNSLHQSSIQNNTDRMAMEDHNKIELRNFMMQAKSVLTPDQAEKLQSELDKNPLTDEE